MLTSKAIIIAASLCADSFAVTLCSGTRMKNTGWKRVAIVSVVFALIHCCFLLAGWALGNAVAMLVLKVSRIIGFLLLLYVGSSMFLDGLQGKGQGRDLTAIKGVILGAIATSIDALAVGAAISMEEAGLTQAAAWRDFMPLPVAIVGITIVTAAAGLKLGKAAASGIGKLAEIIGGLVLLLIAVTVLLGA